MACVGRGPSRSLILFAIGAALAVGVVHGLVGGQLALSLSGKQLFLHFNPNTHTQGRQSLHSYLLRLLLGTAGE